MVDVTVTDGDGDTGSQIYPLTVKAEAISGTIVSSLAQSSYGEEVTLTATFSATPAGSAPMTGTVAFYDGNTYLGTEPLIATGAATSARRCSWPHASPMVSGTSRLSTSSLSVGDHIITAVYSGDANYSTASTESPVSIQVIPAVTSVTLTASTTAQGTTLTANVVVTSPGNPPIVGTVSFYDGSTLLGTVPVSNGVATLNVGSLSAGSHSFSCRFLRRWDFLDEHSSLVVSTDGPRVTGAEALWVPLAADVPAPQLQRPTRPDLGSEPVELSDPWARRPPDHGRLGHLRLGDSHCDPCAGRAVEPPLAIPSDGQWHGPRRADESLGSAAGRGGQRTCWE